MKEEITRFDLSEKEMSLYEMSSPNFFSYLDLKSDVKREANLHLERMYKYYSATDLRTARGMEIIFDVEGMAQEYYERYLRKLSNIKEGSISITSFSG